MPYVSCAVEHCKYNKDGECDSNYILISDKNMTSAGFIPMCEDYEEKEDGE